MRQRTRAGGKSIKAQRHQTGAHKSRITPKDVRPHPVPAAARDTLRLVLETALDAVVGRHLAQIGRWISLRNPQPRNRLPMWRIKEQAFLRWQARNYQV